MKKLYKYLLTCTCICTTGFFAFSQTDIEKVRTTLSSSWYFNYMFTIPTNAPSMAGIMNGINADGSFNRSNPATTVADLTESIYKMTYVFEKPDSVSYYQNAAVKAKIYNSLNYWLNHIPAFTWTSSAMDQPTKLGMIMIKLYDNFQTDESDPAFSSIISNIRQRAGAFVRHSWSNGLTMSTLKNPNLGTNLTDDWHRMGNLGYRLFGYTSIFAAITDSASMDTLSTMVSNQLAFQINKPNSPVVAAMFDGSLNQHGPQTYNIGYGGDFLRDLARFATWTKTSKWKLTSTQQQFWGDILLNGMQWFSYKNHTAHSVMGRHNERSGTTGSGLPTFLSEFLAVADSTLPQFSSVLALKNKLTPANSQIDSTKYLWNSHLIMHHSPKYFAAIKMLSNRTVGAETSDASSGQGLMNFHVADGSTMLYKKGTEYDKARVGWNWRAIPGATIKQKTGALPLVPWSTGYESDNSIAGGVSDGIATIGVFSLSRTNSYHKTKAIKSYFAFKDILVCMGNSISDADTDSGDIYTTLDQTERLSDIYYSLNGGAEQSVALTGSIDSNVNITSPSWYWQDSTGYIIIPQATLATNVILKAENRSGNWYNLDKRNANATVSVNIFQLSINHGSAQNGWKDQTYRYVVVPSVSKSDLITFFNTKVINHDSSSLYLNYNNSKIVSVSYNGYTGVFFTGAGYNKAIGLGADSLKVSSSNYAALLLKRKSDGIDLHASDLRNGFYTNNSVNLGINRIFSVKTFTPSHANGAVNITPATDSSVVKIYLSKTNQIYEGEPVDISAKFAKVVSDSIQTSADSYVKDGSYAGTNYGTGTFLEVKKDGVGYQREAYVKFDLKKVHGKVLNAKLRLYSGSTAATQWQLYRSNVNSWTETGITWNNKPAGDTLLSTISGAAGYVYWDITKQLQYLPSDSILSLKIVSTVTGVYGSFTSLQSGTANQRPAIVYITADEKTNPNARTGNFSEDLAKNKEVSGSGETFVSVFPNPVSDRCTIASKYAMKSIVVYDENSRVVRVIENPDSLKYELDMESLTNGVYLFSVSGEGFVQQKKVLKLTK
ncbi:Por secretion system C-terminal sorting domain-containing protein [Pseudarcicella hirudinis]|uniref:Por secretion system C-terminal sorting domain-containing protein n=1 Tax=Pseudarcicella hirudinis TaxID=1079859 RepID=A0A1I5M1E9_9BACT|nr:polysaccharide lyase family 8 super-sandwich domain-containing protein [Pseudarcicella hirudinis]SFP03263.1 Por secretion system C-terminal sorting domain-containing protein [Pseudarcicella hirudinis]